MNFNPMIIFNIVSFQVLWWLCVLSAKPAMSTFAILVVLLYTLAHLRWVEGWQQTLPLLMTAMIGTLFDQFGYWMGWISFPFADPLSPFIPGWMAALWLAFASTLNVSLAWLQPKPVLSALLGALFGPLTYWCVAKLGMIILPSSALSLFWFAAEWAILMPTLLLIRVYFNQAQGVAQA